MKGVTIKDVAARAGVGISTVSRVLNGSAHVRPQTRQCVLEAARELNYQPNNLARSLATGSSGVLGLVIPDITNPFFPALARGVEDAAHVHGYTVILCNTDGNEEQERKYARTLREQRVDGVILSTSSPDGRAAQELLAAEVPVVLLDRRVDGVGAPAVLVDNRRSAYLLTRHLLERGHRRIGMITGPPGLAPSREREAGFGEALAEAGLTCDRRLIRGGDFRYSSGYERMQELWGEVTAVFCANDLMAIGAIRAIEDRGGRVPGDVAVVGFDDIDMASLMKPTLTTVRQPAYRMGVLAAEVLLEILRGERTLAADVIVLQPQLMIRESS